MAATLVEATVVEEMTREPLTLQQCYNHLRLFPLENIDSDGNGTRPDDDYIMELVASAREYCEDFTHISLADKTYMAALDAFPSEIELPYPPLIEILSIQYDGETLSDAYLDPSAYVVKTVGGSSILTPAVGQTWPSIHEGNQAYIYYRAGYAVPQSEDDDTSDADNAVVPAKPMPRWARQAMYLIIGHWYRNREEVGPEALKNIPLGAKALLNLHKRRLGMA